MRRDTLLNKVKHTIRSVDQHAQIILYGSRARGDFDNDSDWDLLVLLPKSADNEEEKKVRKTLFQLELESGEVLSTIVDTISDWNSERNRFSPFYQNVTKEGIVL